MSEIDENNEKITEESKKERKTNTLTKGKQADFLAHLAFTSDILGSAEAVESPLSLIYKERQNNPDFARRWSEAQRLSYGYLEAALVCRALKSVLAQAKDDEDRVTFKDAVALLAPHLREPAKATRARKVPVLDPDGAAERFGALLKHYKIEVSTEEEQHG